jgi:hypothetical protein
VNGFDPNGMFSWSDLDPSVGAKNFGQYVSDHSAEITLGASFVGVAAGVVLCIVPGTEEIGAPLLVASLSYISAYGNAKQGGASNDEANNAALMSTYIGTGNYNLSFGSSPSQSPDYDFNNESFHQNTYSSPKNNYAPGNLNIGNSVAGLGGLRSEEKSNDFGGGLYYYELVTPESFKFSRFANAYYTNVNYSERFSFYTSYRQVSIDIKLPNMGITLFAQTFDGRSMTIPEAQDYLTDAFNQARGKIFNDIETGVITNGYAASKTFIEYLNFEIIELTNYRGSATRNQISGNPAVSTVKMGPFGLYFKTW